MARAGQQLAIPRGAICGRFEDLNCWWSASGVRGCPGTVARDAAVGSRCSGPVRRASHGGRSVRQCTRARSGWSPAEVCGASAVRTRPIDPCRWGRTLAERICTCARWELGQRHRFAVNCPKAGDAAARRCRVERVPAPPGLSFTTAPARTPSYVCWANLAFTAGLHQTCRSARSSPSLRRPVAATGRRVLRGHGCCCPCRARQTRCNSDEMRGASYGFGAPDRPLRGRPGPRRQEACSPERGRTRTSTATAIAPGRHWWTGADDTLTTTGGTSGSR